MAEGFKLNIVLKYDEIISSFEKNSCRGAYFKNNDEEYWELINKAILIVCKMSEWKRKELLNGGERYKFDTIRIGGGGGGGDTYTVFSSHLCGLWDLSIGDVEINFKKKTLMVWLEQWHEEDKEICPLNGRRTYCKKLNLDELEQYIEKYQPKK